MGKHPDKESVQFFVAGGLRRRDKHAAIVQPTFIQHFDIKAKF